MIDFTSVVDVWAAALWRASWQGGLFLVLVWLLCRFAPAMPARFQAWLWRLVLLKFLIVLVWFAPIELRVLPEAKFASETPSMPVIPEFAEFSATSGTDLAAPPQSIVSLPSPWLVLLIAWCVGVSWQIATLCKAWRIAKTLRNRCRPIDNSTLLDQLAEFSQSFGLRSPPMSLETRGKGSPLLIGILQPAIVIPTTTLGRLDLSERTLVLGHELAHIRRGDLIWNFVAACVRTLFFFHPLIWFAERRLQLAQEIAADEQAIRRQQRDPVSYGSLFVSIVGKLGPDRSLPALAVGTAGSPQSLRQRIVAMQFVQPDSRRVILACGLVMAVITVIGLVPWKLVAAGPSAKIMKLVKADDFWSQTGAKNVHDNIAYEDKQSLIQLAGNADDTALRIRAFKLLADLHNRTRYTKDFTDGQILDAVEGAFRYLEKHITDEVVAKFRPELGFTHITVSKRSPDQGNLWVLIESSDSILPAGGLNIGWNPATKAVDKVEHWGANRNPSRRPGVAVLPLPRATEAVAEKDVKTNPVTGDSKQTQFMASVKISQGPQGKKKIVLAEPNLIYVAGHKAEFQSGTADRQIDLCIESDVTQGPIEHTVAVKITSQPQSKTPTILALPRIRINEGQNGFISVGDELEINVIIERVKPAK